MLSLSVITPTLRENHYLTAAIDSLSGQLAPSDQHLLVTSPQAELSVSDTEYETDLVRQPPSGLAAAFNEGIERSRCDLVGFLSADDRFEPGAIKVVRESFEQYPNVDIVYGGFKKIDERGQTSRVTIPGALTPKKIIRNRPAAPPGLFVRRDVFRCVGLLDPNLTYRYWQEWLLRCVMNDKRMLARKESLYGKRRHRGNRKFGGLSNDELQQSAREQAEMLQHHLGTVPAHAALELARYRCAADGVDELSPGFDRQLIEQASQIRRSLGSQDVSSTPHRLSGPRTGLASAHLRNQAIHTLKYPRALTRFLPRSSADFLRKYFRSYLFKLHQHEPRQPYIIPLHRQTPHAPLTIGIVTPNYNCGEYLERTIRSVIDQDYPDLQYVIQDGGSDDNSVELIKRYEDRLHHWDSRPDSGQTQAINRGMQHVDADVMAYLNSDDILLPGTLTTVCDFFQRNPDVDVIYGHRMIIDENDMEVGRWILPPHNNHAIRFNDFIPQETMFWRRSAWDAVGNSLDESFQFAMDWDLILRFRAAGMRFARIPRILGGFRVIESQKTQTLLMTTGATEINRLRIREFGRLPSSRRIKRALRVYRIRQWFEHHSYSLLETTARRAG